MKRIIKFLTSKLFLNAIFIALQLFVLITSIRFLVQGNPTLFLVLYIASIGVALYVVSLKENPAYKLLWMALIIALPIYGSVIYMLFGNKRVGRKFKKQVQEFNNTSCSKIFSKEEIESQKNTIQRLKDEKQSRQRLINYLTKISSYPVYQDTSVEYFPLGEDFFESVISELKKAKKFIYLEYFILEKGLMLDAIIDILKEKVKENVSVKILYDDFFSSQKLPKNFKKQLVSYGFEVTVFNPIQAHLNSRLNFRDHRKILVIDNNVGYCGGINLADEYMNKAIHFGKWKDTAVKLEGNAVQSLTLMFLQLWCFSNKIDIKSFLPFENNTNCFIDKTSYVIPYGDNPLDEFNVGEYTYMQIINSATKYVWICTPYLVLDNEMIVALELASQSNVDVRIICPHYPDKIFVHPVSQSYYKRLIDSGVKIYEYIPGFTHAKMFVSDDEVAIVGTTNMDYRSFYMHFECGVLFYKGKVVESVKNDFKHMLCSSWQVTKESEDKKSLRIRFIRSLLKLFSPML